MRYADVHIGFRKVDPAYPDGSAHIDEGDHLHAGTVQAMLYCPECRRQQEAGVPGVHPCGPFILDRTGHGTRSQWSFDGTGPGDFTLSPSVARPVLGGGSNHAHFFVTNGQIEFCSDSGGPYVPGGKVLPLLTEERQVEILRRRKERAMTQTVQRYSGAYGEIVAADKHEPDGSIGAGHVNGTGFTIAWQPGPRGHDEHGQLQPASGAAVEDVLAGCFHRLKQFEGLPHDTEHNGLARDLVSAAIKALGMRRRDRAERGVEGTQQV